MDIVNPYGWWEQPPAGSKQETWTYHPEIFGRYGRGIMGGSVMAVYARQYVIPKRREEQSLCPNSLTIILERARTCSL
jgi:hypothetical protein